MSHAARTLLASRGEPVRLIIYDCDGVLIDSEPIANRIVAEDLTAIGWTISAEECDRRFLGLSYHTLAEMAEEHLGRHVPDGWLDRLLTRVSAVLAIESIMVPGALEALAATEAFGLGWCVGSNSSQQEMAAKFGCTGMLQRVHGRLYSGHDIVARGGCAKPAPDLFLAAAAAMGIAPSACLVIEDSPTGAQAARDADMTCLGLARFGQAGSLAMMRAAPFASMHDLPDLLRLAIAPR